LFLEQQPRRRRKRSRVTCTSEGRRQTGCCRCSRERRGGERDGELFIIERERERTRERKKDENENENEERIVVSCFARKKLNRS
jgi:hypothetical protein